MDGVVLLGNPPMLQTGYGSQLRMIGERLKAAGYSVAHICDYGYAGQMFELNGVEVYGCSELPGKLTSNDLASHILDWRKRNLIENWCLIGLGNFRNWGQLTKGIRNSLLMVPVDGDDLNTHDISDLHSANELAGISRFGAEVIHQHFPAPSYLPHGYDPELVKQSSSHRAVRASATFRHATGCFLVGFLGDMSLRKCPKENIEAFVRFAADKEDVRLWVKGSNHFQAEEIGHMLELLPHGTVMSTSSYDSGRGLTVKEMGDLLIGLDVLLHCSSQEGFGIYQIEAQAVGTPVINTAFGAMKELNAHADLMVVPKESRNHLGVNYPIPSVDDIVVRLETCYKEWKEGKYHDRHQKCIQWAEDYDFDRVFEEHYLPTVQRLMKKSSLNQDKPELSVRSPRKMQKVAFLSTYDTNCGIATYTKMLADSLVRQNQEVFVLAEATQEYPIGAFDLEGPIKVLRCWDRNYDAGGALQQALDDIRPDVIHVQHEWALFSRSREMWEVLRHTDARVVFTYHTPDFVSDAHDGAWSHLLAHSSFADAFVTHNEFVAEEIRGRVFPPVAHIPHGIIKHLQLQGARAETKIPDGVPMLLNYGFASRSKGTLDFIRALEIVQRENLCPYFEAVIYAGDHPHWEVEPYLQQCAELAERIPGVSFIREFLDDDRLDLMLSATDFVVFPYSGVPGHEILSTSGAVMRSLGAGKPLICTDEGRLRDLIGGVHCIKASKRDPKTLAVAIQTAVNMFHSDKRTYQEMGQRVEALAADRDWGKIAVKHLDLYSKVCSVWSVRPDRVMPVKPIWVDNDAKDLLEYNTAQSSQTDEEE
tara:strand:- start:1117 stop:3570 length:2454 start_codon:yes stop_codon:yes gene_type:complete